VVSLSLAGNSVVPGRIFVVESEAPDLDRLHSASEMVVDLTQLAQEGARGRACDGVVGVLQR